MPKYLAPIDLTKNELQNFTVQNLGVAYSTPPKGAMYYDTGTDRLKVNIGTSGTPNWTALSTSADTGNAFSIVTGDSGTATADAVGDTIALTSANSILGIVASAGSTASVLFTINQGNITHNSIGGLTTGDPHTQYALLAGRAAGQTLSGGDATAGQALTLVGGGSTTSYLSLNSNSTGTKTKIYFGANTSNYYFDEANSRLVLGVSSSPQGALDVSGAARFSGVITSTQTTGTAPFVVASTTVVTNLNADLLDGFNTATTRPGNSSVIVTSVAADGKIDTSFMTGKLAASDLTNGTTGSGSVVLATSPTIGTPTIDQITGGSAATSNLTFIGTSNGTPTTGGGYILSGVAKYMPYSRTISATLDATVEICSFTPTNAVAYIELEAISANNVTKKYMIPIVAGATSGAFMKAIPIWETGPISSNDFSLEISVAVTTAATTLRLRRTATTGSSTVCQVALAYHGTTGDTITASTTTSTSAITAIYPYAGISNAASNISTSGNTLNMGIGTATTGGGGLNMAGGSITNALNITATGTIAAATFSGAFSGSFATGSQSSPSITFTGRTDAGFYSPAANAVAIVTNNTEWFRANSTGIGFFAATPVAKQGSTVDLRQALINYGLYTTGGATPLDLNGGLLTAANATLTSATGALTFSGGTSATITATTSTVPLNITTGGAASGAINIQTGNTTSSGSGSILISTGQSSSATAGSITINASNGTSSSYGAVNIQIGSTNRFVADGTGIGFFSASTVAQQTGDIKTALSNYGLMSSITSLNFAAGGQVTADTITSASGSAITVRSAAGQAATFGSIANGSGATGAVTLSSGAPSSTGTSGNISVVTGATSGAGTAGSITIGTGTTVGGTNGNIQLQIAGTTKLKIDSTGVSFFGGSTVGQQSGDIRTGLLNLGLFSTATSLNFASGGTVTTDTLQSVSGTTGSTLAIAGGASSASSTAGGSITITAGAGGGTTSNGGNVTVKPGTGTSAGGNVQIQSSGGTVQFKADSSGIAFLGTSTTVGAGNSTDIRTQLTALGLMTSATTLNFASGGSVTADTLQAVSAGTGSALSVVGGASSTASVTGGAINITGGAGNGTTATGGAVVIKGGAGTSTGGAVQLQTSGGTNRFQANTTGIGFFTTSPVALQSGEIAGALVAYGLMSSATSLTVTGTVTGGSVTVSSSGTLTLTDGVGVSIGSTSGTVFGNSSAKIGFFGATAIAQQAQTVDLRTLLINLGFYSGTGGATPLNLNGGAFSAATGTFTGNINMSSSGKITNLVDPTGPQDAATKAYVDATATGLDFKASVRAASTANIAGTYSATGGASARGQFTSMTSFTAIDGVTLATGNRVLLKNQSTAAQNGIWVITSSSTWDRATDFDQDAEVTAGAFVFVEEGTTNADSGFVLTTDNPITIGGSSGTSLTWTQFSGAGTYTAGSGLTLTGTAFSVNTNSTLGTTITSGNVVLTGQALALHQLASNGLIVRTGSGTVAARQITSTGSTVTVTNGTGVSGDINVDISSSYPGQTSITTLGTITTGTWTGTTIAVANGGTGGTSASAAKTNLGFMTRYAATITGDGTTTSFAVTHNMGTKDVIVEMKDSSDNVVYPNFVMTDNNTVTVTTGFAIPNLTTYRVIVIG